MDPQNPAPGGQPPAADNTELKDLITGMRSDLETKFSEFDTKITDLTAENADLKKYITDGGGQPPAAATPPENTPGWQPKSWDEFPQLVEQKAQEIVDKRFKDAQTANQQANEEQSKMQQQIDREIDNQLDKLTKDGILPAVTNARDPKDPGNAARKELLALGVSLETPNLEQVAHNVLVPQHEAGNTFDATSGTWLKSDRPLPGRYAPVGSSSSRTTSTPSGPSYDVIRKARSMDELVAYADQHGYGPAPAQT